MLRLYLTKNWKPYFEGARDRVRKGKTGRGDIVRELGEIYSGRMLQNHSKRLGQPVISEEDVGLFKDMKFTLEELEKKLPYLRIKMNSGQIRTVKDIIETYRKTGDIEVLSKLAEIKSEKYIYSTKAGENSLAMELKDSWFEVDGQSCVGAHGKLNGTYTNFDSFSVFRYSSTKGEVLAINLQDGVTNGGFGFIASNTVNQCIRDMHMEYDWDRVLDGIKEGSLSGEEYLSKLKETLLKQEQFISATTLSIAIIIRTEDKMLMIANMLNGNSPIVKINKDKTMAIFTEDLFQMKTNAVIRLAEMALYFDRKVMIMDNIQKGDTIVIGSDGIVFMDNILDSIKDGKLPASVKDVGSEDDIYRKTEDDGTVVVVRIKE